MTINITANNLDLTPPFREYIEEKINSLDKLLSHFDPGSVTARVVVARTTNHHKHGDVYHADGNLKFPGEVIRAEAEGDDPRKVIDEVKDKLHRELVKIKEIRSGH